MNRATKILPKNHQKRPLKIEVLFANSELHQGLDSILKTRTLSKAFGDTLLQFLWIAKNGDKAGQVNFSRAVGAFLDSWISKQKGGAHER